MVPTPLPRRRAAASIAGIFVLVVATDQAAKWWSWRQHAALINRGGFIALRPDMRAWFAAPTVGAVADAIGALLVLAGVVLLLRRPRRPAVLLGGALVAAGWTSNLLDRFGLHEWTAPGSVRGVVDFIPTGGGSRSNVADAWIALGVLVLVGAAATRRRRVAPQRSVLPVGRNWNTF
jgi:MYXO-CTERM domain-containing protein